MRTAKSVVLLMILWAAIGFPQEKKGMRSFKKDVLPLVTKRCLPCHAEDNFNPSELSLDNYEMLMAGGKKGVPVVPGKGKESIIVKKLGTTPPFGERMPLNSKKKIQEGRGEWLSDDEIGIIVEWIDQGAKDN